MRVRVTRRSAVRVAADRLDTSEFVQQVYEASGGGVPRVRRGLAVSGAGRGGRARPPSPRPPRPRPPTAPAHRSLPPLSQVKASQVFSKWRWRDRPAAGGGPTVVATQVVSEYLTPYDGDARYAAAMGRPTAVYTYKVALTPTGGGGGG